MKTQLTPKILAKIKTSGETKPIGHWDDFIRACQIGGETITPFDYQRDVCTRLVSGDLRSGMVIKSRQLGLTLTTALTMSYLAQLRPGIQMSAVSIRQEDSSAIGKRIRRAAGHLLKTTSDNVLELALTNGSLVRYLSANAQDPGRGNANVEGIFIDEAAFYDYRDLLAALAPGTLWSKRPWQLVVSTPSDVDSQFYGAFCDGLSRPYDEIAGAIVTGELPPYYEEIVSGVSRIWIHYTAVPKFAADPTSYLKILIDAGLSPQDVQREANLSWLSKSQDLVFNSESVRLCAKGSQNRKPTGVATIGIDPSGFGRDRFAMVVTRPLEATGVVQVTYERSWGNYDGSQVLADMEADLSGVTGGVIVVESNGVGVGFLDLIKNDPRFGRFKVLGHSTNRDNKARALAFAEWLISAGRLHLFVSGLPSQLTKYQVDKAGKSARGGDDYALALIHALQNIGGADGSGFTSWYRKFWVANLPQNG